MKSPYQGVPKSKWLSVTKKLIEEHPLSSKEIVQVSLKAWDEILNTSIGTSGNKIGKNIFPKPQIMGFFLHELIPLILQQKYPKVWQVEKNARDKDLLHLPDDKYSIEIKTSSHPKNIFGNRSYAQKATSDKKSKSGYYLAINFEKFNGADPKILLIRFGWLDHEDWTGQKSSTGQQARLSPEIEATKLIELYRAK